MTRKVQFIEDEYYHVYNRGTEKRKIFLNPDDYNRFLAMLYVCNSEYPVSVNFRGRTSEIFVTERGQILVDICAYCLMPNHFHLIVRERSEGGVSKFMQKLITGYTMYFNKINERSGALFQGKFKATHIDDDRYLSYLISYIHLNPVKIIDPNWKEVGVTQKNKAKSFLDNYTYSSYLDYCGKERQLKKIINPNAMPTYSETPKDFKASVETWLEYSQEL